MADWQFHLELKDLRKKYNEDRDMPAMCRGHVERIKELVTKLRKDPRQIISVDMAFGLEEEILPAFEELADDPHACVDDFDAALKELYDWADTPLDDKWGGKKMCWINTF